METRKTPLTLDETFQQIEDMYVNMDYSTPLKEIGFSIMKDFLAQKFLVAYMRASPEQLGLLKKLYAEVTKKKEV